MKQKTIKNKLKHNKKTNKKGKIYKKMRGGNENPSMNFFPNSSLKGGNNMQQIRCNNGNCNQSGGYSPTFSLIGSPWGGSVSQWPGVDGVSGGRNYFTTTNYSDDPQTFRVNDERFIGGSRKTKKNRMNRMNGKKRINGKKVMKGGSVGTIATEILPESVVNLARGISHTVGGVYGNLMGSGPSVNPAPFLNQLPNTQNYNALQNYLN